MCVRVACAWRSVSRRGPFAPRGVEVFIPSPLDCPAGRAAAPGFFGAVMFHRPFSRAPRRPLRRATPRARRLSQARRRRDLARARLAHRSGWMFIMSTPAETRRWLRQVGLGVAAFARAEGLL